MYNPSVIKTCAQLFLIGPTVSWRLMTMTIASAQVIAQRSRILMKGPKNKQQRREISGMVFEKFWGAGEATHAGLTSLVRENTASAIELISLFTLPIASHKGPTDTPTLFKYAFFPIAIATTSLLIPTRVALSVVRLFLESTQPLHKRVTANAKRLHRTKQFVN